MNRTLQIVVGTAAVIVISICLALNARFRITRAREFGEPHQVTTHGGTNYVVELSETTVGRTEDGHILIVYLNIKNPNDHELSLDRNWFVLLDPHREYFQPSISGTQEQWIRLDPHAVQENVMLSFLLGPNALQGGITLKIGSKEYWVPLKSVEPYQEPLEPGQFRSFKHNEW